MNLKFSIILYLSVVILWISCKQAESQKASTAYLEHISEHREHYLQEFIKDKRAPLDSMDLQHVNFFKVDENYNCVCDFVEVEEKKPFPMGTYSGITKPYQVFGNLTCDIKGKYITLEIYQNATMANIPAYADHLFLPFKDYTNGENSYGGGRYLDILASNIKDGKLNVDFNKAYNPWCTYSDGYNCPIPPKANHLQIKIEAGESNYTGPKKKRPK